MRNQFDRNERYRVRSRRRELLTKFGYLLCGILIFVGIIFLVKQLDIGSDSEPEHAGEIVRATVEYKGEKYALRTGLETVLFIGYDSTSDAEAKEGAPDFDQSDFLFLLVADKRNGKYSTIHIDRDTMTNVMQLTSEGKKAGEGVMQIALAYAYGGEVSVRSANAVKAVTDLIGGERIAHYVTFGMDSVPVLNNVVGGVSVEVPVDIDDDLKKTEPGEKIKLTDDQALRYVRARQSLADSSNVFRMERQRSFIEAFIDLFGEKVNNDPNFIADVVENDLASKVHSDDLKYVSELAGDIVKLENAGYYTLEGEHKKGEKYVEFYPDEDALRELVLSIFYDKVG
jgi:LCP family protein required for cell wall assembly